METGFVIGVGNAFDGIKIYSANDGAPFGDHDSAVEVAEMNFKDEEWCIVPLYSVSDVGEESDEESDEE